MPVALDTAVEKSAMRKIYLRLLPFAILCYILAYIDRINVELCRAHDARRPQHDGGRFRLRRRNFLLGLFPIRGAEQRHHGKGRRPHLDRPHHDHLGHLRHGHGVRDRHDQLRRHAVPARRGRGRLLSRHDPLFHLLVSRATITPASSRASWLACRSRWRSARRCRRPDEPGWACSASGAGRSCTSPRAFRRSCSASSFYFLMTDRPAQANFLDRAGEGLAGGQARRRASGQGGGAQVLDARIACATRRCCCWR